MDFGSWFLVAGYWMLDTGCSILDARYWILDTGCWKKWLKAQGVRRKAQALK
jgi:hypothetical protein